MARGGADATIATRALGFARRAPERVALVAGEARMTYRAFGERILRVASAARAAGLKRGDVAALIAGNRIEYPEVVAGLSEAGIAVATLAPRQTERELSAVLSDCGARFAIVDPGLRDLVMAAGGGALERVVTFGAEYETWIAGARPVPPDDPARPMDAFSIPYTSGTTGRPKGVALPHRSRAITFGDFRAAYPCYGEGRSFLAVAPFYHGAGFALAFAALDSGGTCEVMAGFDVEAFARRLGEGAHEGVFVVPTMLRRLLDATPAALVSGHRLTALTCNAAALPDETRDETIDRFGEGLLHELYGSTEAGVVTSLPPEDQRRKRACVGPAFRGAEIRILDDDGNDVAPGETGELFSRTETIFLGYWNRPEATAEAFRGEWFSAGDLARCDEEGYYYIQGRKTDMIVSGGVNIHPKEIEDAISTHPAIAEIAVAGAPSREWGEEARAFVVLRPGAALSGDELLRYARARLSPQKTPKRVVFLDALPRNAAGKLLKRDLRERKDDE